ncbi:hypothetical protein PS15m_000695 [Mucor circinelloides]
MPLTWMIVFGAFLIPFDSVNQKYLDNAYLSGELRIQIRDTHFPNSGPVTVDLGTDTALTDKCKAYKICRWIA